MESLQWDNVEIFKAGNLIGEFVLGAVRVSSAQPCGRHRQV